MSIIEIDFDEAPKDFKTGIFTIEDNEYFKLPYISASTLKRLLNDEAYEVANKIPTEKTEAMTLGSLIHCMILEPDEVDKRYAVMPKVDLRTAIGKETKMIFERENQGKEVVKDEMFETAKECYKSICETGVKQLFEGGEAEKAIQFEIGEVQAKGKLDYYKESKGIILDVKTTQNAGEQFATECSNRDYFLQGSFYFDGLKKLGKNVNDIIFVGVQTKKPYKVTLVRQELQEIEFGRDCYLVALEIWKDIQNNPEKYKSKLTVNPQTGENIFNMQIPTYKHFALDRLKKQLNYI